MSFGKMFKYVRDELYYKNFRLNVKHHYEFTNSKWTKYRWLFALYRVCIFVYMTAWFIYSLILHWEPMYFAYLTNISYTILYLYVTLAMLTCLGHQLKRKTSSSRAQLDTSMDHLKPQSTASSEHLKVHSGLLRCDISQVQGSQCHISNERNVCGNVFDVMDHSARHDHEPLNTSYAYVKQNGDINCEEPMLYSAITTSCIHSDKDTTKEGCFEVHSNITPSSNTGLPYIKPSYNSTPRDNDNDIHSSQLRSLKDDNQYITNNGRQKDDSNIRGQKKDENSDRGRSKCESCHLSFLWLLFNVGSISAVLVTTIYYSVLLPWIRSHIPHYKQTMVDINYHCVNSAIVIIEVLVSNVSVRCLHFIYGSIFAFIYFMLSLLYWYKSPDILYPEVIDWNKPAFTSLIMLLIILGVIPLIQLVLFILHKFRQVGQRKVNGCRTVRTE